MKIKITVGSVELEAVLNNTATALKIRDILPIRSSFNTWGDEIYFALPIEAELDESAREVVELGDLGYWPSGSAFCIFFGRTPMSTEGNIVPASAVNVIGRVKGDATALKAVMHEKEIRIKALA